ncbi:MAG: NAD(P)-binding protein [Actinobacteria bacterium]|nr:NAD(P)-binding protein [Actinomycetota bacterium]
MSKRVFSPITISICVSYNSPSKRLDLLPPPLRHVHVSRWSLPSRGLEGGLIPTERPLAERVPFLVIGGGIGGLTASLAAASAGYEVHLIEQNPDFVEIGAGIQLAPNAARVLDRLGLFDAVEAVSVKPQNLFLMHTESGKVLTRLAFGKAFRRRYGYPYVVLHRGDLLGILLDACKQHPGITLETNKKMVEISDLGNSMRVACEDGTEYDCDAVVGVDGLWSRARSYVSSDEPIYHGYVAFRGAIPTSDVPFSVESDDEFIWIGPGKHFVQYPIRRGELYNQVAVFASPGFRPEIAESLEWGTQIELEAAFSKSCETLQVALTMIHRDRRWPMLDRVPLTNWRKSRLTLLGDAAHPMLQYLAQGACQAIEDADCLGRMMREHRGDIVKAFDAYQEESIPRTTRVQLAARWWGRFWHDDGDIVPALRDRILTTRAPDDYSDTDWLYMSGSGSSSSS